MITKIHTTMVTDELECNIAKIISDAWDAGAKFATEVNAKRFGYYVGGEPMMTKEQWMRAHHVHLGTEEAPRNNLGASDGAEDFLRGTGI